MLSHEHGYLNALATLAGARTGAPRKPYRPIPESAVEEIRKAARRVQALEGTS
jgi:hypothetical protein